MKNSLMKNQKMSPQAWRLFDLLTAAEEYGQPADLKTICEELEMPYTAALFQYPSNSPEYRHVWNLVEEINNSLEVDKCVYRAPGYKFRLANKRECIETYVKLRREAIRLHNRADVLKAKMYRNNQGKLLTNQDKPMNDKAKPFHEAFAEGER